MYHLKVICSVVSAKKTFIPYHMLIFIIWYSVVKDKDAHGVTNRITYNNIMCFMHYASYYYKDPGNIYAADGNLQLILKFFPTMGKFGLKNLRDFHLTTEA